MQHSCSHSNAICNHRFKKRIELRTQERRNNFSLQNTEEEPKPPQTQPPHTRGTFHRRLQPLYTEKHKVSCSSFLPTTQSMQHSCSHSNAICNHRFKKRIELRTQEQEQPLVAEHRGGTAAHTRYLSSAAATLQRKTQGFVLRLLPHNTEHATFMQPFQCDLQPQIQETHRTTHAGTQEQPRVAEHRGGTKMTPAATAAHMRQLSSPAAATLNETQGFVLRLPPHNREHATFMIHAANPPVRSATTDSRNA